MSEEMQNVLKRLAASESVPESEILALKEIDEPVEDTDTTQPPEETTDSGYTDSGYSSSNTSGTSGVYTIKFNTNGGEGE
ncbi:MAG: hypothetical protein J6K17_06920, partial [Oscillospiraceae bacterium]|nr:hypothetical protein [Oscillospiraceae bacterium]